MQKEIQAIFGEDCEVLVGPWISYGKKVCQPDVLVIPKDEKKPIAIVEVKLTYKTKAKAKLERVYGRVCKELYPGRKQRRVQVFKRLRGPLAYSLTPLEEMFKAQKHNNKYVVCHWLG